MNEELVTVEEKEITEPSKKVKKPKSKFRKIFGWVITILFSALFIFFAIGQGIGIATRKENNNHTLTYGHAAFVITSDSMEPYYPVKSAIITHKDSMESLIKDFDAGKAVDVSFDSIYLSNNSRYNYPYYRPVNEDFAGKEPTYPRMNGQIVNTVITHRVIEYFVDETREYGQGRYTLVVAGTNLKEPDEGESDGEYLNRKGQYQLLTENEYIGRVKMKSMVLGRVFIFITTPWGLLIFLLIPAFYLVITSVLDIFKAIKEPEEGPKDGGKGDNPASLDGLSQADRERLKQEMLKELLAKKGDDKDGK